MTTYAPRSWGHSEAVLLPHVGATLHGWTMHEDSWMGTFYFDHPDRDFVVYVNPFWEDMPFHIQAVNDCGQIVCDDAVPAYKPTGDLDADWKALIASVIDHPIWHAFNPPPVM